jgi:hypothetical protein
VDHRWPLGSIEDHELKEVSGTVRPENQIADGIIADLLDDDRMSDRVLDSGWLNAMPARRWEHVHTGQS